MIGDLNGNIIFFDVKTLEVLQSYKFDSFESKLARHAITAKERALAIDVNLTLGLVASGNQNGSISIWDIETCELLWQFTAHTGKTSALGYSGKVFSVCFLENNWHIASAGGDNLIKIWNVTTRTLVNPLKGHTSPVLCLALKPNSTLMASSAHDSSIWKMQFSKKGELLSIGKDGIKIWDSRNWELIKILGEPYTTHVAFALNLEKEYLAIANSEGVVEIWDVVNWKFLQVFLASETLIHNLCFSCDGQHLVLTNKDAKFKIIPIDLKMRMHKENQHFGRINEVCVSTDGHYAASASFDNTIHI